MRRHPHLWLNRGDPGGGMYDCLMIAAGVGSPNLFLNRLGTVQIHSRFDGGETDWRVATWEQYLHADPKEFLLALKGSAGLVAPPSVPATTRSVLLYRVFAVLSALSSKSTAPYAFEQGYIDSSGDDAGPNSAIDALPEASRRLRDERAREPRDEPGFRYWMVFRQGRPCWAFERESGDV